MTWIIPAGGWIVCHDCGRDYALIADYLAHRGAPAGCGPEFMNLARNDGGRR